MSLFGGRLVAADARLTVAVHQGDGTDLGGGRDAPVLDHRLPVLGAHAVAHPATATGELQLGYDAARIYRQVRLAHGQHGLSWEIGA